MIVERTDFVSVPATNLERSAAFYRDTLGLEQTGDGAWPEFRLGANVFLYLLDPTNIGQDFAGRTLRPSRCAWPTSRRHAPSSRSAALPSTARRSTPVCATWLTSRTRTAMF